MWLAVPPFLIGVFVVGLFVYINATARPLHPDPQKVPSVTQWSPSPKWSNAVEQGRLLARAGLIAQNLPGLSVAVGNGGDIVWVCAGISDSSSVTNCEPLISPRKRWESPGPWPVCIGTFP